MLEVIVALNVRVIISHRMIPARKNAFLRRQKEPLIQKSVEKAECSVGNDSQIKFQSWSDFENLPTGECPRNIFQALSVT
jgi:hypothetical protein